MIYFIVVLFSQALGQETWRYCVPREDQSVFTSKDTIELEYFGNQLVRWCFPKDCSFNDSRSASTTMTCRKSGYHAISPVLSDETMVRYINIVHSPFCFYWYLTHHQPVNNLSLEVFRIWVVHPEYSSNEEKDGMAMVPSWFSRRLSFIFHYFGQQPQLTLKTGYASVGQPLAFINITFNANYSYWEFITSYIKTHQNVIWISGNSLALYDCYVRDGQVQILHPKYVTSVDPNRVQLIGDGKTARLITDPCAWHIAVYIGSSLIFTQDNFKTTSNFSISVGLLEGSPPTVKDVLFFSTKILFLLEVGKVLMYDGATGLFTRSTGLAGHNITHLVHSTPCCVGQKANASDHDIIAWDNMAGKVKTFISRDGGYSFDGLFIPWPSPSSWYAHDVLYHQFYESFFFLIQGANHTDLKPMLLQYSSKDESWQEQQLVFANFTGAGPLSFTFIPYNTHLILVWSTKTIMYGRLNGQGMKVPLTTRYGKRLYDVTGAADILSITTGPSGDYVALLEDGRMFYGRLGAQILIEIYPGEGDSNGLALMFDLTGRLLLVTNSSSSSRTLERRYLPVKNEVTSGMFPNTICPFLRFSTNASSDVHYMDKGEAMSVWVSLTYRHSSDTEILYDVSSSSLVDVAAEEHRKVYRALTILNKTFTFSQMNKNGTGNRTQWNSGPISVVFHPTEIGLTCPGIYHMAVLIQVGCRPDRHIRIRNCSSPATRGQNDMGTDYHSYCSMLQCELPSQVGQHLILVLDLYDGETQISEVQQNYVLWEENGKTGYRYTATMSQVGCIREAQTWRTMGESWNQHNYESCFDKKDDVVQPFDRSQTYPIVNSSGMSHIFFTREGLFTFTFKVIDPNVSFCTLSGRFTVRVSPGEQARQYLVELIGTLLVVLLSSGFLGVSYWKYRKETLGEHEQDRQTTERLQQLRTIFKEARSAIEEETTRKSKGGMRHSVRRSTGTAELLLGLDTKKSSQGDRSIPSDWAPSIQEEEAED